MVKMKTSLDRDATSFLAIICNIQYTADEQPFQVNVDKLNKRSTMQISFNVDKCLHGIIIIFKNAHELHKWIPRKPNLFFLVKKGTAC